ncbi:putative transporter SEO1 [Wickerhamomyces ciferrii]|uniref:Transporter SEO1 n=1 Tax=Wickerhamomyces ciferrii (strain ATCC 14091 / BCRC 22168 / CBS 111 / JCM 3599 / NBRC 0793 / NRRL Y-1031 F-60-10) TaxID=1206466 RepID=K0KH52_WICCF|nr:putative transporter SEO1 [Wickerhamomyces ciferrii]CCH40704.1 putative transporter SEO1 [Wickerhamomyces ciferrii]
MTTITDHGNNKVKHGGIVHESEVGDNDIDSLNQSNIGHDEDTTADKSFDSYKIPSDVRWKLFWSFKTPRSVKEKKQKLFLWTPPGQSKYETRLVFKLDCIILTYVCLSFFVRMLDASNVSNAYVSGMKEDLNMHGTMYNWLTRSFYLAYAVAGFPITLLVTKIKPRFLLPTLELLWGVFCLLVITCKDYKSLMIIRGIQGALEGGCFPILHVILGTFYTTNELSTRTALFIASGSCGTMFGGYIQSGVYKTLNGAAGMPGWRWIFVIDFLITIPVAILGYFIIPDAPYEAKPTRFLSQKDIDFCKKRVLVVKNVEQGHQFGFNVIKKILTSWQFYLFTFFYTVGHIPGDVGSYWNVVLKEQGYNVYQRNNYPTIQSAFDAIGCILAGMYADSTGRFLDPLIILQGIWLIAVALIVKWDIPTPLLFICFVVCGASGGVSTLCCAWANDMTREDHQLRAAVIGSLNLIYQGPHTVFSIMNYNTDLAPKYERGNRYSLGILSICFLTTFVIFWFDRYQRRKRDYIDDLVNNEQDDTLIEG